MTDPDEPEGAAVAEFSHEVIDWIRRQDFFRENQAPNYVVGVTRGGNVIISKVGGVTSAARGIGDLWEMVRQTPWFGDNTPGVYLAQRFTHDGNNNHAEMCALAAADALADPLDHIRCTADNCDPCHITLEWAGVTSGNGRAPGTQTGWVHPRGCLQLGTSLAPPGMSSAETWRRQTAELRDYHACADKEHFPHRYTRRTSWPPQGSMEQLS